jgi:protein TonB
VISNPNWDRLPDAEDLARYFPDRAARLEQEGRSVIECTVRANGTVTGCRIVSEDPSGFGFGDAHIRAASRFRMRPKTADGAPVEGGTVRIPLRWTLPS